jgi:hypothetical protein
LIKVEELVKKCIFLQNNNEYFISVCHDEEIMIEIKHFNKIILIKHFNETRYKLHLYFDKNLNIFAKKLFFRIVIYFTNRNFLNISYFLIKNDSKQRKLLFYLI